MPVLDYFSTTLAVANSAAIVIIDDSGIRLRQQDAAGKYDPSALYPTAGEYVTFPNLVGTGIATLWGFQLEGALNDGVVDCQLSANGGTSYLYWNTGAGAWAAAGAGDWSLPSEVREHIAAFPLGTGALRGVRLKLRLRPDSTRLKTPVIRNAWFIAEFNHDPATDVLRSVKGLLAGLRFRLYEQVKSAGGTTVKLSPHDYTVDTTKTIACYNVTDDPGRGTNLFASYNSGTSIVTLTASQTAGKVIETWFYGSCPVVLVPDSFVFESRIPSIEVQITPVMDEMQSGGVITETNEDTLKARTRIGPRYLRVAVEAACIDKDEERAFLMAREIRKALHETIITSKATGLVWPVANVQAVIPKVSLSDGVFAPTVGATIWVREDAETYAEDALITSINARLSDFTSVWYDEVVQKTS